jgi:hypothetical protein
MDEAWLTPADKKSRKAQIKSIALQEAERQVFGDPAVGQELRATMDERGHPYLDECLDLRINPLTAPPTELLKIGEAAKIAITALLAAPTHRDTIAQSIASARGVKLATAQRDTKALFSFLQRCGRINFNKKTKIAEIQ